MAKERLQKNKTQIVSTRNTTGSSGTKRMRNVRPERTESLFRVTGSNGR